MAQSTLKDNLERVAQRELQIALTALGRYLSKIRTCWISFRVVPVRMVGPVEGLESERELLLLLDEEILEQGKVVVLEAGTIQEIANPLPVESTGRGPHEDRRAIGVLRLKPVVLIGAGLSESLPADRNRIALHDPELRAATWSYTGEIITGSD